MQYSEDFLFGVILQLAVIIAVARAGAWLFGKLGQPQVVGEILAGLMLGPSLFGRFAPELAATIFPAENTLVFKVLSELGLAMLMLLVGLEFDFSHLKHSSLAATKVAFAGIITPFALGSALGWWMHPQVAGNVDRMGFTLIIATALSITAIPVLGRIMVELGIQRTRLGVLTITAAAIDDVLGWVLLAGVAAMVRGNFEFTSTLKMLGLAILFVIATITVVAPIGRRIIKLCRLGENGQLGVTPVSLLLAAALLMGCVTSKIGIFTIFGPFVLGAVLSNKRVFAAIASAQLRPLVYGLLVPIFFTSTGLRTNIGALDSPHLWGLCLLILAAAVLGKAGGCGLAAWSSGMSVQESTCVALMMNTRALMGLVAINVGRELGVVPDSVFSMLVIMAVVTTLMATPLLRRLLPADLHAPLAGHSPAVASTTNPLHPAQHHA